MAVRIASIVPPGAKVLEVGPGPGFLSIELARRGLKMTAVENKRIWIEMTRRNAERAGVPVEVCAGDPADLPVASESMDFVVCRAAFNSFAQPAKAMREMRRVLRAGGTGLLCDLRRDVPTGELRLYVDSMDCRRLHQWFMLRAFDKVLSKRAYVVEEIRRMAYEAGWVSAQVRPCSVGFEAWIRK